MSDDNINIEWLALHGNFVKFLVKEHANFRAKYEIHWAAVNGQRLPDHDVVSVNDNNAVQYLMNQNKKSI